MIREPIYETIDDARRGKIAQSVKAAVVKLKPGTIMTRRIKLNKAQREEATEKAKNTLERLSQAISAES